MCDECLPGPRLPLHLGPDTAEYQSFGVVMEAVFPHWSLRWRPRLLALAATPRARAGGSVSWQAIEAWDAAVRDDSEISHDLRIERMIA